MQEHQPGGLSCRRMDHLLLTFVAACCSFFRTNCVPSSVTIAEISSVCDTGTVWLVAGHAAQPTHGPTGLELSCCKSGSTARTACCLACITAE